MEHISIRCATLRANAQLTFDLFIKINQKYVLYIKKGDPIDQPRLQRLVDQKVDRLYITKVDFPDYEKFISDIIDQALEDDTLNADEKVDIVENASVNAVEVLEEMLNDPQSEAAYRMTLAAAKGLRKVVMQNPNALKKIYTKKDRDHSLVLEHCKNVSALGTRFAFLLGYRDKNLDNFGAAALLHDIGLNSLKPDELLALFSKKEEDFDENDNQLYRNHPIEGAKLLQEKEYVNQEILNLIAKHEEKRGGSGYPKKVDQLAPLEEILSLTNTYDKLVTVLQLDPNEALQEITTKEIGNYDLKLIKKLKAALKAEGII